MKMEHRNLSFRRRRIISLALIVCPPVRIIWIKFINPQNSDQTQMMA